MAAPTHYAGYVVYNTRRRALYNIQECERFVFLIRFVSPNQFLSAYPVRTGNSEDDSLLTTCARNPGVSQEHSAHLADLLRKPVISDP